MVDADLSSASTDYMKLTSSFDFFVLDDDDRWTIRSKWECPVLNFANVTATGSGQGNSYNDEYVKGMWHQYGELSHLFRLAIDYISELKTHTP